MPATDNLPRTLGPYRLQDRLGEGGMGVVHLARDPEGRAVAVKVLHPLGTEGVNARRRLTREDLIRSRQSSWRPTVVTPSPSLIASVAERPRTTKSW